MWQTDRRHPLIQHHPIIMNECRLLLCMSTQKIIKYIECISSFTVLMFQSFEINIMIILLSQSYEKKAFASGKHSRFNKPQRFDQLRKPNFKTQKILMKTPKQRN